MTVPIEDLIRDAQERQADRAIDLERIWAALPASRRRHVRQRRLGMIAAFAAVVAVAAVVTVPTRPAVNSVARCAWSYCSRD